jgi:hypothetical protein
VHTHSARGDRLRQQGRQPRGAYSVLAWSSHQHQGRFNPSPNFGLLPVAAFLRGRSSLRRLGNCLGTVRFQELSGVGLDFGGVHGVTLLFVRARQKSARARER